MNSLLSGLKDVALRGLSSLKVWTTLFGILATMLAKKGIVLDPALAQYVAGFFGLLLVGQAANDHGKAAALIHAANAQMGLSLAAKVDMKLLSVADDGSFVKIHMTDGSDIDITDALKDAGFERKPKLAIAKSPESGFFHPALGVVLSLFAIVCFCVSCAWWSSDGKDVAQKGGVVAAGCVLQDVLQYSLEIEQALATETFRDAVNEVAKKHSLKQETINCLIQTVLAVLGSQPAAGSGQLTQQPSMVRIHARVYLDEHGVK